MALQRYVARPYSLYITLQRRPTSHAHCAGAGIGGGNRGCRAAVERADQDALRSRRGRGIVCPYCIGAVVARDVGPGKLRCLVQ